MSTLFLKRKPLGLKAFFIIALVFLVVSVFIFGKRMVSAHVTGASWEKVVDGYKLDIGYDPTTFVAGQAERLDFNIVNPTTGESVPFSDVWIRISKGEDTVFASGIHRLTFGLTTLTLEFPGPGSYDLNTRFENDDNTIVQSDFPITVESATDPVTGTASGGLGRIFYIPLFVFIGLVSGFGLSFVFKKRKVHESK